MGRRIVGDGSEPTHFDEHLLAHALSLTPGRALDVGCGTGGNVIGFAELGWVGTGIDQSPKAIASARLNTRSAGVDASFFVADATTCAQISHTTWLRSHMHSITSA